jgi:hypothetical protein
MRGAMVKSRVDCHVKIVRLRSGDRAACAFLIGLIWTYFRIDFSLQLHLAIAKELRRNYENQGVDLFEI